MLKPRIAKGVLREVRSGLLLVESLSTLNAVRLCGEKDGTIAPELRVSTKMSRYCVKSQVRTFLELKVIACGPNEAKEGQSLHEARSYPGESRAPSTFSKTFCQLQHSQALRYCASTTTITSSPTLHRFYLSLSWRGRFNYPKSQRLTLLLSWQCPMLTEEPGAHHKDHRCLKNSHSLVG